MSQSDKSTRPKIRPTSERIKEITLKLMNPENKVAKRLKIFQLFERVAYIYLLAEDWPDPASRSQRYQPRQVAAIIALAEFGMEVHIKAVKDHETAKSNLKNQKSKLQKKIEKIERTTKKKFSDLPSVSAAT